MLYPLRNMEITGCCVVHCFFVAKRFAINGFLLYYSNESGRQFSMNMI